jgi:hypothetical protein
MTEKLSKSEIRKDQIQDSVEAATQAVGQVSTVVVTAVGDVVKAVGGFATDLFEIRAAARTARKDNVDEDPQDEA